MNGYDDIDLTLQHEDDIAAYEKMRAEKFPFKPRTTSPPNTGRRKNRVRPRA